jgi:hypothetical protein
MSQTFSTGAFPQFDASGATGALIADRFINTFIAGEDLTGGPGLAVYLSAAYTVKRVNAANMTTFLGITMTKAASGAKVTVLCRGFTRAKAFGSISAGDQLTTGPASQPGTVQTDNSSKNTTIIGMAIQAISSGATGIILLW